MPTRNPLQPFALVVSVLAALSIAAVITGAVAGAHPLGIGDAKFCVDDPDVAVGGVISPVVRHGVAASNGGLSLCPHHATLGQETLNVLTQLPSDLFAIGLLLLLWRLVVVARRHGPFAPVNGRYLRLIAWWLIAGSLIADNVQTLAHTALERSMLLPDLAPTWTDHMPDLSLTALITGLGMLTVARILTMATAMHDELAATI